MRAATAKLAEPVYGMPWTQMRPTKGARRRNKNASPTDRRREMRNRNKIQRQKGQLFMDRIPNVGPGQEGMSHRKVTAPQVATWPLIRRTPCQLAQGLNPAGVLLLRQGPSGTPVSQVVGGELTVYRMLEFARTSIGLQGLKRLAPLLYRIARVPEGLRPKGARVPEGHRPKGAEEAAGIAAQGNNLWH